MKYRKSEAKEWAKENFKGIENCLFPSFTPDLRNLDEKGIRHDVKECIKHGFFSTLLVPDAGTTKEEMKKFMEIAVDEAKGKIFISLWLSFNSFEDTLEMVKYAEGCGCDSALLGYPPYFYPKSEKEIYDFTERICNSTDLAINLYPSHKYNFERFHPSAFPPQLLNQMADIENVVGMKYGTLSVAGFAEAQRLYGHKILVQDPSEANWPIWIEKYGMQWAGAGPYEYLQTPDNPRLTQYFNLMQKGDMNKGMELYWQLQPARAIWMERLYPTLLQGTYHYPEWKYMGWLVGFNGGPLRLPVHRLYEHIKERYRASLRAIGITPREPDEEFYVGKVNY